MRVYRVAKESDRSYYPAGPYQSCNLDKTTSDLLQEMYNEHCGSDHPVPQQEGFSMRDHHVCAFSSEAQLYKWFAGWEMHLDVCDFRIYVYDVPYYGVWELEKQTVVDVGDMEYVTDYALTY